MEIIDYFYNYTKIGYQVIPIYPLTKIPVGKNWNHWNYDKSKSYFQKNPTANIGVLLGDIVDVEGDTDEANQIVKDLIGNVPHPMYKSSKSIHHLFENPDRNLTATRFLGMEFRAFKHQSVLPPSQHGDGSSYHWIEGCSIGKIPTMPDALMEFYWKNKKVVKSTVKKHKSDFITTFCSCCQVEEKIHKKRLQLEIKAFQELNSLWRCHYCRPWDVRPLCREIKRNLKKARDRSYLNNQPAGS